MNPVEAIANDLLLRPFRPDDADAVHRACQDPDIHHWLSVPVPYLLEHAKEYVTRCETAWDMGTGAPFAVCDAVTGELLASCGLITIDRVLDSAEIGYWTAPWARGRGVAVRATRAVARWAFDTLDLRRIVWQAEIGNHASRLVALRAGFTISGLLPLANPRPDGAPDSAPEGWLGWLVPADLDRPIGYGPDSLETRRAAVFGRAQPVLPATTGRERLTLRPLAPRDIDAVVAACRDPETVRWTTVPDPYQRADAEFFVGRYARRQWARGDGAVFAIADETGAYAGSIELRLSATDPLVAEVGYLTAPQFRGRGYLPTALRALCGWGFATLGLARVEWRANVGNTASRRAAEKAGFVFEGTARSALVHRGERIDGWIGALLPGDLPTK